MHKKFIAACLIPLFIALTAVAEDPAPKPYENWPATDQEWNTLTNHIMWCYNSLRDRECVATGRTNNFVGDGADYYYKWEPSLVCPFRDYSLIARNIDRLAPYFVNHSLAGTNNDFSAYFGTTNSTGRCPTEFPRWTPESLHSNAFERADWSTNTVLTIWMAVTNRSFIAEVTKAINMLKWTSCVEYDFKDCDQRNNIQRGGYAQTNNFTTAVNLVLDQYQNNFYPYTGVNNFEASSWTFDDETYLSAHAYRSDGYAFHGSSVMYGKTNEGNPFAFQPQGSAYVRRYISFSDYTPSAQVRARTNVFFCADLAGYITEDSTLITYENPIGDFYSELDDPVSYAEFGTQLYATADYREQEIFPLLLVKWQFGEAFPQNELPNGSPIEIPDTDIDGIVQTMPVDGLPGSETGTFAVSPEDERPLLHLPLSTQSAWDGSLPVHAYLSQGAVTNLPYHYCPWMPSRGCNGPLETFFGYGVYLSPNMLNYSLNSHVLDCNVMTNSLIRLKQVAILRPRGEVVIFDFPWEENHFSKKGYPIGVNRNLGYVLYHLDENDDIFCSPDVFCLLFPSGVGHLFGDTDSLSYSGWAYQWPIMGHALPLSAVFNDEGLFRQSTGSGEALISQSSWYRPWTQNLASVRGEIYDLTFEWDKGIPRQVKYWSSKTSELCETVTIGYRNGMAYSLDKNDAQSESSVKEDNSVLYGTGIKRVRQQTGTRETERVVNVKTFADEGATTPCLIETCTYDNRQRLSNRTLSASGQSVSSGYTYKEESSTDERYPETGLLVRNSVDTHTRTGSVGSVTENYTYTPVQGWPSLISYSQGGENIESFVLDYYPAFTNWGFWFDWLPVDHLPLRSLHLKSTKKKWNESSYSKTLLSPPTDMHMSGFGRIIEVCHTPDATNGCAENLKYYYRTVAGEYWDELLLFRMYQWQFMSPSSEVYCYIYSNTLTTAGFFTTDESTLKTNVINARGVNLYSKTLTKEGATLEETITEVDAFGRPTFSIFMDNTMMFYYNYCVNGPQSILNRDTSVTTIEYDPFGRIKKRVDGETGITYAYEYDPNGNVTKKTRSVGAKKAESFAEYGLDGALLYSKDESGHEVRITGQSNNGYLVLTRKETGKGDVTETYWADGVLKSVNGDGAVAKFDRERGVTDNKYWVKTINPTNTAEWSTQWYQYNGLFAYTEQPDGKTSSVAYDEKLRPKSGLSADSVSSIATYDAKYPWLPSVSGVSLGGLALDLSSDPYCVSNSYAFTSQGLKTTQYSFPEDNSATPFKDSSMQVSLDGRTGTFSVQGRTGTFSCNAAPSTGTYTKTVNLPGGGIANYTYSKFLLRKETMRSAGLAPTITKTYEYDSFNRLEIVKTDERGFMETTKVVRDPVKGLVSDINSSSRGSTSVIRENDKVKQITTPSGTTTFDWKGNGSIESVQQVGGPKFSRQEDAFGRDTSITRQNDSISSSLGFTYGNDGAFVSKTRDGQTKISVSSRRADGRSKVTSLPDGITVATDYDDAGRESGQTWTDPNNPSGNVTFTYSWMRDGTLRGYGQAEGPSVSNSVARTDVRIESDTSTFGCPGTDGASVQTFYDAANGTPSLVSAGFNGFAEMPLAAAAAHDAFGNLYALSGAEFTNIFSCAGGGLVTNTLTAVPGGIQLSRSVIWSAQAGKPARVEYSLNGQFLRRWQYAFTNSLIASVTRSGGDGYRTAYAYDGARQLIGATSSTTNGQALPGLSFAYEYTLAGDTTKYGRMGRPNTTTTTANDLQTVRMWSPYVHLLGRVSASSAAVSSYTSFSTNRVPGTVIDGLYYSTNNLGDLANATFGVATVIATPQSGTAETARVSFSLQATTENPTYNARGMILADSRRQYRWDAAERLLSITNNGVSPAAVLSFQYYPDGRRARKTVSCFTNNAWTVTRSLHYAWQGWKLAAECERDGANNITAVRHFVWGPDIAGQQTASLESGAEGVGGLLLIREWKPGRGMRQYLPLTDGLGNVCGLLDGTDGFLAAEYDYDPYGGPVIERGIAADACPFRHRTRYYDSETWLYYYGYRYYDPSTTKWISKDPIGEAGGWNLTCFCDNDPVNGYDPLGLAVGDLWDPGTYVFNPIGMSGTEAAGRARIARDATDKMLSYAGLANVGGSKEVGSAISSTREMYYSYWTRMSRYYAIDVGEGHVSVFDELGAEYEAGGSLVFEILPVSGAAQKALTGMVIDDRSGGIHELSSWGRFGYGSLAFAEGGLLLASPWIEKFVSARSGSKFIPEGLANRLAPATGPVVDSTTSPAGAGMVGDGAEYVGKEIALGKDVAGGGYKALAEKTGASRWENWAKDKVTQRTVLNRFGRAYHQAAERASKIHFSLDGIDDVGLAVKAGKKGFFPGNMTNAELEFLFGRPDLLKKTIFYRGSKIVPSPFGG